MHEGGKNWFGQTAVIYTHTYTHAFSTFTPVQFSVNSHVTHAHSRKRWKPGKYGGWQRCQLVSLQIKIAVWRENRDLGKLLSYKLKSSGHTKNGYLYIHTLCMYACMYKERQRASSHSSPPQLQGLRVCSTCASVCACAIFRSFIHCICLSVCTSTSMCPVACIYND